MSTLTTQQKSDIDKLWTEFWTGGITNPLTVIEQISFLMFARLLDVMETTGERKAERTKKEFHGRFKGARTTRAAGRTSSRRTPPRCCGWCATRCSRTSAS
jgi:type I restriction enzyme M protein